MAFMRTKMNHWTIVPVVAGVVAVAHIVLASPAGAAAVVPGPVLGVGGTKTWIAVGLVVVVVVAGAVYWFIQRDK